MKELLRRTATGIALVGIFTGSVLWGPGTLTVMVSLICLLGTRELYGMMQPEGNGPFFLLTAAGISLPGITYAGLSHQASPLWFLVPALLGTAGLLRTGDRRSGLLAFLWLGVPLAAYLSLGWFPVRGGYRPLFPMALISMVWTFDTFAYLTGKLAGKHPMTPRLSPGKTWEGFIGGLLVTLVTSWIVFRISGILALRIWLILGFITAIAGFAGDLFESRLKRSRKVKDTGTLLPGHGGILDRFDSLLFLAPAAWLYLLIIRLAT